MMNPVIFIRLCGKYQSDRIHKTGRGTLLIESGFGIVGSAFFILSRRQIKLSDQLTAESALRVNFFGRFIPDDGHPGADCPAFNDAIFDIGVLLRKSFSDFR